MEEMHASVAFQSANPADLAPFCDVHDAACQVQRPAAAGLTRRETMRQVAQLLWIFSLLSVSSGSLRIRSRTKFRAQERHRGELMHSPLPEARTTLTGKCSQMVWEDKLVVAARYDEDVSWMAAYLVPWLPFLIYSTSGDKAATHMTLSDKGREAQAYLQFIADYYDCLPLEVAFIHAHRASKHSPDMLQLLKQLRWGSIPGYMSLSNANPMSTFYFSNPDHHKPDQNDNSETAHWSEFAYQQNIRIQAAWPELFQNSLGPIPDTISAPCCGQFIVTRSRIKQHSKAFYEESVQWLQDTELDSFWAGLIFEHTWPYIFGAGAIYTHPETCSALACDRNGTQLIPTWESLMSQSCLRQTVSKA